MIQARRRLTIVGGKGGVGKTTIAAAMAVAAAGRGDRTLVVSVDPAHSLGDALDAALGPEPLDVPGVPGLRAMELDARHERDRWMAAHRETLAAVLDRGTYLDRADIEQVVQMAPPGLEELAAVLRLIELVDAGDVDRIVVDTAPTGHALRLLAAPAVAAQWLASLRALNDRHHAVVAALAGPRPAQSDPVDRQLAEIERGFTHLRDALRDPGRTAFVLVTTAEPVVAAETRAYAATLREHGIALEAVIFNRTDARAPAGELSDGVSAYRVPNVQPDPRGPAALRALLRAAQPISSDAAVPALAGPSGQPAAPARTRYRPPADRRLYVIAGKGGVGKTTTASALALVLAESGGRVLVQSVDPAGSLGAVWNIAVTAQPAQAPGTERVWLRQLAVEEALSSWRARWEPELARAVVGDAAGTAPSWAGSAGSPPGADEIVAMLDLVDLLDDARYDAVVLDTAPTGHLLRLLAAPALAREWAHTAMRILLRHRSVIELGELGEQLLRVARDTKRLEELLESRAATMFAVVTTTDALACRETPRLAARLREWVGAGPELLLVNRATDADGGMEADALACVQDLRRACAPGALVLAPRLADGPRGAEALRRLAASWQLFDATNGEDSGP